jgi:asparagine synthetase B (glutamine-hydrolysing)
MKFFQARLLEDSVRNRGPDYYGVEEIKLNEIWNGFFAASILHTQGDELTKQPVRNSDNDILLWNGDIFGGVIVNISIRCAVNVFISGKFKPISIYQISDANRNLSDTEIIFRWLQQNDQRIPELLTMIEGPYSFVYYNNKRNEVWFGRDPLGRHSLLWSASVDNLLITSVGHKTIVNLTEVPALGIFCFDLNANTLTGNARVYLCYETLYFDRMNLVLYFQNYICINGRTFKNF